tara:strand:- start:1449 stop:3614 length:2166 start_codon:yes stop_codon:yes gene_type:complete
MAFQVSPGVLVKEVDLTNVVPALATSIGGLAGVFSKGPMDQIIPIGSEKELVQMFGLPDSNNFETWFTAANFLDYGNALRVVRANNGARNAVANGGATIGTFTGDASTTAFTMSQVVSDADLLEVTIAGVKTTAFTVDGTTTITFTSAPASGSGNTIVKLGVKITNDQYYDDNYADGSGSVGSFASRYPGAWGNSIGVSTCGSAEAFEQILPADNKVNESGNLAVGATAVTVDDGAEFVVGDIVYFQEANGQQYEVTGIATHVLTIRQLDNPNGGGLTSIVLNDTVIRRRWKFYDLFDAAPGTSSWASGLGLPIAEDEIHVVVYDTTGAITGYDADVAGNRGNSVIEIHAFMSKHPSAKTPQGGTAYYPTIINRASSHIWWMDHPASGAADWGTDLTSAGTDKVFDAAHLPLTDTLSIGQDDATATVGELTLAYDHFSDTETVDVNLIMSGTSPAGSDGTAHAAAMISLAEARKDMVVFVSPRRADVVGVTSSATQSTNVKGFFDGLASSSYAVFDSGYKYMYDKYADVYRYVPLNGDIAGLCANTDSVSDPWFSPSGYNRGQVRGAVKLAFNPTKSQRDTLYGARINPVVTFPGQGTVLFGDKTALVRPSSFDRINVRRLFLTLEKAIATAAKFQLFEFNDTFTQAQFRNMVEPFLRDVQGRRGITDFSVVCDGTNNTGEIIDRNEFVADIYIKPARSINFITLSFVAVRTGVAFSEVGG